MTTETNLIHSSIEDDIIVVPDRHRQLFSRKPLEELIDSIREVGQIQPGVCRRTPEGLELVVGERRLKACRFMKIPFRYYIEEETDPLLLEQIQLDENLCREDLDWKEEIKAKERLHSIFQTRFGVKTSGSRQGHSLQDTADHIGIKKSILHEDVTLAGYLEIPEVAAAPNKTTAKKIVERLMTQVKRHDNLQAVLTKVAEMPKTEAERAEAKLAILNGTAKPATPELSLIEKQLIYYSKHCIHGTFEDKLPAIPDESLDIVFFDPPWGVDFAAVRRDCANTKDYEDEPESYDEHLETWLCAIYNKLKTQSHLYMFAAITKISFTYDILERVGFQVNRIPIIWWKKGSHVTRAAHLWPAQCYEPICFAHKGGKKALVKQGLPNLIETPMPTSKIKDIHSSAKHPQIYKELLLRSASPGDTILDPMAGSGMLGVAAEALAQTHALNWTLIEKDYDFYNLQLVNLVKGYDQIAKYEISSDESLSIEPPASAATSFKSLKVGGESWKEWWKAHPEDQNAMLDWKMQSGGNVA